MGLHLKLVVAPWRDQAPQPGGAPLDVPVLRAWVATLGAADALRWIEGGGVFSDWPGSGRGLVGMKTERSAIAPGRSHSVTSRAALRWRRAAPHFRA